MILEVVNQSSTSNIPEIFGEDESDAHLGFQKSHFLLQLLDDAVPLLDHHAGVLELKQKVKQRVSLAQIRADVFGIVESGACASHLLDHVSDFPLLAFQHVVQMVDLLFEDRHFLLQLFSSKIRKKKSDSYSTIKKSVWWDICVHQLTFAPRCDPPL